MEIKVEGLPESANGRILSANVIFNRLHIVLDDCGDSVEIPAKTLVLRASQVDCDPPKPLGEFKMRVITIRSDTIEIVAKNINMENL